MCELFALSSHKPVDADFSLTALARSGSLERHMNDGWGVAYYQEKDARLIKDTVAAEDSAWLKFLESHTLTSDVVLAHIRKASIGARRFRNTQPYYRELGGRRHVFVHNGSLPGIFDASEIRLNRFHPIGETDSEYAFCAMLGELESLWHCNRLPTDRQRFECVNDFAARMRALGPANFLYTDGDLLFAHSHQRIQDDGELRPPGLFFLKRTCAASADVLEEQGISLRNQNLELTLFASVPLTSETWEPMQVGQVMCTRQGQSLRF